MHDDHGDRDDNDGGNDNGSAAGDGGCDRPAGQVVAVWQMVEATDGGQWLGQMGSKG